jgi:hypothetical protein
VESSTISELNETLKVARASVDSVVLSSGGTSLMMTQSCSGADCNQIFGIGERRLSLDTVVVE